MNAEYNVIGALLMDSKSVADIASYIKPKMFENRLLGRVYQEYLKGYDNHYEVDLTTLTRNIVDENTDLSIFLELINKCSSSVMGISNIKASADTVVASYKAREGTKILNRYKLSSNGIKDDIGALINDLENLRDNRNTTTNNLSSIAEEFKATYFRKSDKPKTFLGFDNLDDMLGGLEGGDVIVIGARPAVGKSALVTQITSNLAKQGKRVGFYNLEMREKQVYERFLASESGIGLTRLRQAESFLGDEEERFNKANEVLLSRSNIFLTTGSKSVSEIRTECRNMDYDLIIIDYLQLLKADISYKGNRYAEVGSISKAIKGLSMELNIPIIVLSQLNRASEQKDGKEPSMSELRESGDIEQDASIIILLWNCNEDDPSKKGIKVAKNRQGLTGKYVLNFNGDNMKFTESQETIKQVQAVKLIKDEVLPFK